VPVLKSNTDTPGPYQERKIQKADKVRIFDLVNSKMDTLQEEFIKAYTYIFTEDAVINSNSSWIQGISTTDMTILIGSCLALILFYAAIYQGFPLTRQRAWLTSVPISSILTVLGLIAFIKVETENKWTYSYIYENETKQARLSVILFLSYQITDFLIGYFHFLDQFTLLTTYIHHTFYIWFMFYLLSKGYCNGFQIVFFMELPTAIMAIGKVFDQYRSDIGFGVTFFIARIVFHIYSVYRLYCIHSTMLPMILCGVALILHFAWFKDWIGSYGVKYYKLWFKKKV
jgi:hypothetical protein